MQPIKPSKPEILRYLAEKYIWWKTAEEALQYPQRIAAQVMNMGDYDDVQLLVSEAGNDYLRDILINAEAGQFNARSWNYWHYRLGLASPGKVPHMPGRRIA